MKRALTPTGINILGSVPWGTHLGLFYETQNDFFEIVVPYFSAGLKNEEFCLWIFPHLIARQDALEALKHGVSDFDRHLSEGNVELISDDQWYMPEGSFEIAAVLERFHKKISEAISKGNVGLRVNGSAASLRKVNSKRFNEYKKNSTIELQTKKLLYCVLSP